MNTPGFNLKKSCDDNKKTIDVYTATGCVYERPTFPASLTTKQIKIAGEKDNYYPTLKPLRTIVNNLCKVLPLEI